jgi:hypothetical protein
MSWSRWRTAKPGVLITCRCGAVHPVEMQRRDGAVIWRMKRCEAGA